MKYVLFSIAALALCLGIGRLLVIPVQKKLRPRRIRLKIAGLSLLFGLLAFCGMALGYLSVYYRADPAAVETSFQDSQVQIQTVDGGYFFDGPGDRAALVFYPGAKVESLSYAPLMTRIARQGVDCFLAEVPFHMAIFGSNAAEKFMNNYAYEVWATAGHSMGGIVAAGYAADHPDEIDTVILLASYPTAKLDSVNLCSIYGSCDGCLGMEAYENHKINWPGNSTELCIDGGNHAWFGNYGVQRGDGVAAISAQEQQEMTAEAICDAILNN